MSLPGRLCVGLLEEDNPTKSYFRFKPLLVMGDKGYEPFVCGADYPEDGCLRIVPDKNESSHFKARMRRTGKYALMDLRAHSGESDKIRPNKNYRVDTSERNSFIVYSDVVVEPPQGMLYEILDRAIPEDSTQLALTMPLPGTHSVLFRTEDGISPVLWRVEPMDGMEDAVSLSREEMHLSLENTQEICVPDFHGEPLHFLLASSGSTMLEQEAQAPSSDGIQSQPPSPKVEPVRPQWLNPREQSVAAQSGLNPRRNRSLQEIIDDKWRRSRFDQLGHPVPAEAMGTPVESPIEHAVNAVRDAWRTSEARTSLVEALSCIDGFGDSIHQHSTEHAEAENLHRLNDLEAQRLKLLSDLNALETRRTDMRALLLDELKHENIRVLKEGEQKLAAIHKEIEACEERLEGAQEATVKAEENYQEIEQRICEHVLESRVVRFMRTHDSRPQLKLCDPSVGELFSDVRTYFQESGMLLSHDEAINLLACFVLSPITVLCGSPFSAKSEMAQLLAGALGLSSGGRFHTINQASENSESLETFLECTKINVPRMILMDDCNAPFNEQRAHALVSRLEAERHAGLRVCFTAQDSGNPLAAGLVDRAFILRMEPEPADSAWQPIGSTPPVMNCIVSEETLQHIFQVRPDAVSAEVLSRMAQLRTALAAKDVLLSRRTLNATWTYCAAVAPLMREHAPLHALDLALAQRVLPAVLTRAPIEALKALPEMLIGLPVCEKLLEKPMPLL